MQCGQELLVQYVQKYCQEDSQEDPHKKVQEMVADKLTGCDHVYEQLGDTIKP